MRFAVKLLISPITPSLRNCFLVMSCVSLIVLSGCAMSLKEASTKMYAIEADCDAKFKAGVYKNFYENAECLNDGLTKFFIDINYPYMDLVVLQNAYRLALAERRDRGEITKTEAQVIMADLSQRLAAEEHKRATNSAYARAAQAQGTGALLQGLGGFIQSVQPPAQKPPITCMQTGNVTRCF
jgi:hypothetical protein